MKYISGLDSLRFLAALVVFLSHLNVSFPSLGPVMRGFEILWANLFNGPAAVILFFVISGLVIHLPYAAKPRKTLEPASFYARRLVRIGAPALVSILVFFVSHTPLPGVLWSVICEAVYYAMYPVLLLLARRIGWSSLILGSLVVAGAMIISVPEPLFSHTGYPAYGYTTFIIGLPVWLGGAWLAENLHRFRTPPSLAELNRLRIQLFGLSVVLRVVKFQVPAPWGSDIIWLTLFGVLLVYWLGKEISYREKNPAPARLERLGHWSYSLYLMHPVVIHLALFAEIEITPLVGLLVLIAGLVASYGFYLSVERPSHQLARRLSQAVQGRSPNSGRAPG